MKTLFERVMIGRPHYVAYHHPTPPCGTNNFVANKKNKG